MNCTDEEGFSTRAREHAQHPHNQGPLDIFDGHARITGPCGDTMEFWLTVQNGKVDKISFITDGCASSLACGSITTSMAKGKKVTDAMEIGQRDILEMLDGLPAELEHCALLAADTLKAACDDYMMRQKELSTTCDTCDNRDCPALERKKDESDAEFEDRRQLQSRLCRIKHKVVVLSGKGGVGKSTVAVNLAAALMLAGKKVGLLDIDIHGPSIPTMLGIERETIIGGEAGLLPVELGDLKVMSLGFMLRNQDDAVIWRGPMKMGVIKQFLKDVDWGDLDYLIIDSPPGTGDEPLSVCQLIGMLDGAVIVTTPQKVAAVDVRKSITFCRQLNVPVLGVIENMSGFVCPQCGTVTQILPTGGGKRIASDMGVPFLGSIPIDPQIAQACDNGRIFIQHYATTQTAKIIQQIIQPLIALNEKGENNI
jgi:ATP-binding protein involved in chromosome partitioning